MPNSKYPQQLDTSTEIPPVRDNITEIGSDVINSLRSAIFKIEATLGINPQGEVGNTVSSRISKSLDASGNILKEALDRSNILSGPIIDSDVSRVASISESKLKLDFPTRLLQDEISILNTQIAGISSLVEEISNNLSIHTNIYSSTSHPASAIYTTAAPTISSDEATMSLESSSVQVGLENLYNSHINFSGFNTSSSNNSHKADQIYYDNNLTSEIVLSSNLQDAFDELVDRDLKVIKYSIVNTSSSGLVRRGKVYDGYGGSDYSRVILDTSSTNYTHSSGEATTKFTLVTPTEPIEEISQYDILTLSGSSFDDDNKDYQVKEVSLNGSGEVEFIIVYGGPKSTSTSGLFIQVTKNPFVFYNLAGFSSSPRPRFNNTNIPDVQILNPDCATIISQGIRPSNIISTNHKFKITIDDSAPVELSTFYTGIPQSIDSIVLKINEQAVEQHLNITAYKVRGNNCYELAISHNVPNLSGDIRERKIKITNASSDNGTTRLGFSDVLGTEFRGLTGTTVILNGEVLRGFGLVKTLDNTRINMVAGTLTIQSYGESFLELGVRVGDLVVIDGSSNSADDGSFRVGDVSDSTLVLDLGSSTFLFSGSLSAGGIIHIIRSSALLDDMDFTIDGDILFDVFMSPEKDLFYSKRLEMTPSVIEPNFSAVISDVSKDFITNGIEATLEIDTSGYAQLTAPSTGFPGEQIYVGKTGSYKIFSKDGFSYIILSTYVTEGTPLSISADISIQITGFDEVGKANYHISRGSYSANIGRILGDPGVSTTVNYPGVPSLLDKRVSGTTDTSVISSNFIEKYIEGPRNELRGGGVISGCEVVDVDYDNPPGYQKFSVKPGIIVVNGIRFEFPGLEGVLFESLNTYVVGIDSHGCIVFGEYIDDPDNPGNQIVPFEDAILLSEISDSANLITDLRFFIDHIDFKALKNIVVSNDSRFGHFTNISDAVQYSKRFPKIYKDVSSPNILIDNGTYRINETIVIDFDICIRGSGPGTILTKTGLIAKGLPILNNNVDSNTAIFLIGAGQDTVSSDMLYGVTLSDFTYVTSDNIEDVGTAIAIAQPVGITPVKLRQANFRFENINFRGSTAMSFASQIGEYAIFLGLQNSSDLSSITGYAFGNIIMTNCRFDHMGLEKGAVRVIEDAGTVLRNCVFSSNIVTKGSPNLAWVDSIILEYPSSTSYNNIIENGNVFRID